MKYLIVFLVLCTFGTAHAAQWELGVGMAHAQQQHNGTWYQEGFAHTLRLNSPVVEAGVLVRWSRHVNWHVDAVYLGRVGVGSLDVPNANYSLSAHDCVGPCMALQHFVGAGTIYGVQALTGYHTTGAWQFGMASGPFLYHASWVLTVPDWYPSAGLTETGSPYAIARYNAGWALGWVAGVTLRHGPWQASLRYYADGTQFGHYVGGDPTLWRGQFAALIAFRF